MKPARMLISAVFMAATGIALAQESKVQLKDAPGRDKVMQCVACHSADYIPMNSHFLDRAGWNSEVNKMINAFGAPIAREDVPTIVEYLVQNYGKPAGD